jgi:hypothetical protein
VAAAKAGNFLLSADSLPAFVPVVPIGSARANRAANGHRPFSIEIVIETIAVRVPGGADSRDLEMSTRMTQAV